MYTEDEAKIKWCPMVRISCDYETNNGTFLNAITAYNKLVIRHVKGEIDIPERIVTNCIASGCMMWRWIMEITPMVNTPNIQTDKGYCGLAGKEK